MKNLMTDYDNEIDPWRILDGAVNDGGIHRQYFPRTGFFITAYNHVFNIAADTEDVFPWEKHSP